MKSMNLPYNDLSKGDPVQPLLATASGLQVATAICYEDAYASEMLYAFPDAGLIINVSNDAWFGDSIAAHQHLEIARMRSLETGRPSIRATNTGISAFIDHEGEIVKQGPQHLPVSLSSQVQPQSGATPFVRGGNTPIVVLCLLILGASWMRSRA
jgi:apolipoprotein N-acyltransferase